MFGFAFVPLNFYSIALLIILAERHGPHFAALAARHRLCLGAQPGRARRIRRGAVEFDLRFAATLSRERLRRRPPGPQRASGRKFSLRLQKLPPAGRCKALPIMEEFSGLAGWPARGSHFVARVQVLRQVQSRNDLALVQGW